MTWVLQGVDANRNWGFHWNEGGSDNDKCSDTYHGPAAFSEVGPHLLNIYSMMLFQKPYNLLKNDPILIFISLKIKNAVQWCLQFYSLL